MVKSLRKDELRIMLQIIKEEVDKREQLAMSVTSHNNVCETKCLLRIKKMLLALTKLI